MKKLLMFTMALMFTVTMALVGTANAGLFGSDKDKSDQAGAATAQAASAGEQLSMSGTIDDHSRFVDDKGEIFALADNEKSMEVRALQGQKIAIKGTVMEDGGQKTVKVTDYNIVGN